MTRHGQKKKGLKYLKGIALFFLYIFLGFLGGYMVGKVGFGGIGKKSTDEVILLIAVFVAGMFAAMYFHIIVHEAGHVIFGLLTGYTFGFYRVGSFLFMKEEGKIHIKKIHISGTGGQCLMVPPEKKNGEIPYRLYFFGGVIMNLFFSGLFLLLFFYARSPFIRILLMEGYIFGFLLVLMNGIPFKGGTLDNDATSALVISKSKEAMDAFYVMLKAGYLLLKGVRLKDMPEELFVFPDEERLSNSMIATRAALCCERKLEEKNFLEAEEMILKCLAIESGMAPLLKNSLTLELFFLKLLDGKNEEAESLLNKKVESYRKSMKNFPQVIRTEYALALLRDKDQVKAKKLKEKFLRVSRTYPYPGEIEAEKECMELVEEYLKKGEDL